MDYLEQPQVDILLPVSNGFEFAQECLESIFNQTYQSWKLHIGLNGNFNPKEAEELKKIACVDPRVRIHTIHPPIRSVLNNKARTLNYLFDRVTGPYLCLIDIDDKWAKNKLEQQIITMRAKPDIDICGTKCCYFGDKEGIPLIPNGYIEKDEFYTNPIINSSVMMKTSITPYWNMDLQLEDYDLWLRMRFDDKIFYNLVDVLTWHRIHKKSSFNTKDHSEEQYRLQVKWLRQ